MPAATLSMSEKKDDVRLLLERIDAYEASITWNTSCLNCPKLYDQIYAMDQHTIPELREKVEAAEEARLAANRQWQTEYDAVNQKCGELRTMLENADELANSVDANCACEVIEKAVAYEAVRAKAGER